MPQIRIVSISPYPEMERIVQDVIAAHPQRGRIDNRIITATVDRLDLSELRDCDAIIARGYSARRLKAQELGVPVIDIAISGYDVIRSIQECQRRFQTRRIGFVGFYNAFNGIEQFSGMFGCDIRVYIPECAAEIRHALELAKQDGCDVIVGGYSVQQDAGLLGLPAILLRTGRETYAQSLEEAIRTVTLVQQERIRTESYKIITESVKDGLLYVDASGIIRLDNPAACLMRDAPLKDVPLETAFPCMVDSFSRAMRDCTEIQGEVRKVRGVSITFDCTPVAVNGVAAGVVISFQNVDKVQQLEGHIRKKLSNKGLTAKHHLSDIVHCSRLIDETIEDACRYAAASSNILIVGETGTGKELFAQGIHNASQRRNGPFVAINCSAFSKELLESEIFGHKAGAFTGALKDKKGLFEEANHGTIFLDEIGEMAYGLQAKLLRVLETGEYIKVGDTKPTKIDVRIVSATNRNLKEEIANSNFREDLYFRLSVFHLHLPPLRERREDIPELATAFLKLFSAKMGKQVKGFDAACQDWMQSYAWPGNVRELRNVIERALIICDDYITLDDMPLDFRSSTLSGSAADGDDFELAEAEHRHIQRVLQYTKGNKAEAARLLKIGLTTLYRKIEEYGINI